MSFRQELLEILLDWGELSYGALAYLRRGALGDTRTHSERALKMRLHRITKRREVSRLTRGGEVFLSLTGKGRSEIAALDALAKLEIRSWDGKWRIVSFDLRETQSSLRDQLRRKLSQLGFGMLQRSVWISPRDLLAGMQPWIQSRAMEEYVVSLVTGTVGLLTNERIVEIAWPGLDQTGQLYRQYPEFCSRTWRERTRQGWNGEERAAQAITAVAALRHQLSEIIRKDPLLPRELLPRTWGRDEALKALRDYRRKFQRAVKSG